MTGSWKGRGNQYIEFARVLYCKLPTNGKQLPAFPHKALTGIEPRPQRPPRMYTKNRKNVYRHQEIIDKLQRNIVTQKGLDQ